MERGRQSCTINKPAMELVTELDRLCVKGTAGMAGQGADAVVLHVTPHMEVALCQLYVACCVKKQRGILFATIMWVLCIKEA